MNANLLRRLVAEFVGTAILVLFGAGSVVAATTLGKGTVDYAGLGIISLSFGFAVALAVYAVGTTSGAHINPAVTIGLAVVRRFKWSEAVPYIAAQLAGAVAGGLLIVAYAGKGATTNGAVGLTSLGTGVNVVQGMAAEALGTFLLLFTVMAVAVDKRAPVGWAGWLIGLAVAAEIMVIGPFTGGSVNPARTFGPYLVNQIFGGSTPWSEYWVYVVGPLVGAAVATLCYDFLARPAAVPPIGAERQEGASEQAPEAKGVPEQSRREMPTQQRQGR
jgi:glycerol uptake facilitator protein